MTHVSIRSALVVFLLFFLAACGGLPGDEKREAKALLQTIESAKADIGTKQTTYTTTLKQDAEIAGYVRREKVSANFDTARAELDRASRLYESEVKVVLDRNDEKELSQLQTAVARVKAAIDSATAYSVKPSKRFSLLLTAKRNSATWPTESVRLKALADADYRAAAQLVDKYQKSYPDKKDAIARRFSSGETFLASVTAGAAAVTAEAENRTARRPIDYARFADGFTAVTDGQQSLAVLRQKMAKDLPALDEAYSKILIDMKDEYTVCVSRTSWQESELIEYPTEHPYNYACKSVSDDAYDTADSLDDGDFDFGAISKGWGGGWNDVSLYSHGDATDEDVQELWKELALNPLEAWPDDSDNSATFSIESTDAHYYHKYAYIRNGVRTEGDWEEVDPQFYEDHWDDLGMALIEKPYGAFEDESVKTAAPPGLSLVGNPKTGEWRSDTGGASYWFWYPNYYPLYGGYYGPGWHGYYRSEWDDYSRQRRSGRSYYGTGNRRYGTHGGTTQTGPLGASTFAQRGGFREAAAEVRTAGPNGRSGGPQSGK